LKLKRKEQLREEMHSTEASSAPPKTAAARLPLDIAAYAQKIRQQIKRRQITVFSSVFSPDGQYLVSCSDQGRIAFWHLDTFLVRRSSV